MRRLHCDYGIDTSQSVWRAGGAQAQAQDPAHAQARGGRIYIYGLLGDPGPVDLSPLIIKNASLHGWVLDEISQTGDAHWQKACNDILQRFIDGTFEQHVSGVYPLAEAQRAHEEMIQGRHIGKLVLVP